MASVMRPLAMVVLVLAVAGCGAAEPEREAAAPRAVAAEDAPLPKMRPRVVQPEAGVAAGESKKSREALAVAPVEDDADLPVPTGPASAGASKPGGLTSGGGGVSTATALPNGVALPPLEAPEAVLNIIRAGNTIARTPYKWGGGHGKWRDNGYDCSGSVSYALNAGGLIPGPATSGQLMHWGEPGKGKWVTVYANDGHVFMEVAGIRFDTSGAARTGSRWQNGSRPTGGYVARHPPGL
jgi:cell wall-associated NlpC family hydrolase